MWWGRVVGSLALAGCLSAPPSSTGDGTGDDGGPPDAGANDSLVMTGRGARDALTVDGRDELVLIGLRDGAPVAFVLYAGQDDLSKVDVVEVPLPWEPVDVSIMRWDGTTGVAVLLGPGGELAAIDPGAELHELTVTESGATSTRSFRQVSEMGGGGTRMVLVDETHVLISEPVGVGPPGEQGIPIVPVASAAEPVLLGSSYASTRWAVGVVEADREIDVYPITFEPPVAGDDLVLDEFIPEKLEQPIWRLTGAQMLLIGIDSQIPAIFYQVAAMDTAVTDEGTILDGMFAAIDDLVTTRINAGVYDLGVLVENDDQMPTLLVYLDPADQVPQELPEPIGFDLEGLEPPYWLQAMEVVADPGEPGHNEIIVYDAGGRLACVDLVDDELASCGKLDLARLTATGASTIRSLAPE